jgi:hypothetical protein
MILSQQMTNPSFIFLGVSRYPILSQQHSRLAAGFPRGILLDYTPPYLTVDSRRLKLKKTPFSFFVSFHMFLLM